MRKYLVIAAAASYALLAIDDLVHGRWRTGVAAGLIALVNLIVYW